MTTHSFAGYYRGATIEGAGRVKPGTTNERIGFCVSSYDGSKYLPQDMNAHVVAIAVCTAGPGASEAGKPQNPIEPSPSPDVDIAPTPPPPTQFEEPIPSSTPTPSPSPPPPAASTEETPSPAEQAEARAPPHIHERARLCAFASTLR